MPDPDDTALIQALKDSRTIAVVGLSNRPERPSHEVASYLQEAGYRIITVNPNIAETLGEPAYPNLRSVPDSVDIVNVFRRPEHLPGIVEDAIAIGAKIIWMQLGVAHEGAAARARAAGLHVVMNTCLATTHHALRSGRRL
jgi:predicted CoA-binding protein